MPYNGAGGFTSLGAPTFPAVAGEVIYASRFNDTLNDVFGGLSVALPRDGQAAATANIPMGNFKFTGMGLGAAAGQALIWDQTGGQLKVLTVTEQLAVTAPLVSYSAAVVATVLGSWNFAAVTQLLVPTAPALDDTTKAANTAWTTTRIATAIAAGLPSIPTQVSVVSGTSQAGAAGFHYILTNVAATTVTLPATPASGDTVWVTWTNSLATNVIARNAQTIMGLAEDMTLDASTNNTVQLRFVSSSWRLV